MRPSKHIDPASATLAWWKRRELIAPRVRTWTFSAPGRERGEDTGYIHIILGDSGVDADQWALLFDGGQHRDGIEFSEPRDTTAQLIRDCRNAGWTLTHQSSAPWRPCEK